MDVVGIRKCLVFSVRSCWRYICRHPFVAGLLLFMLFLYRYFPSIFIFLAHSSPVIACTSLLLGTLLIYGEPYIPKPEDINDVDVSVKSERCISEENLKNREVMNAAKDGLLKEMNDDGNVEDNSVLAASSSRKNTEKKLHNKKIMINEVGAHEQKVVEEVFSVENPAECSLGTAEGLNVEVGKPLDKQFESSLGSPWQKVHGREISSGSESDGEESSLSPDTSLTDVIPIIDELNPLLESENLHQDHRSIDSSDAISGVSSPELESDDGSAEEETENQADDEDEDAREEKDNNESVVKWTADDEKNLMDLGSSELERNRRLENLIAKRRAKKLQRFQTDKNLIDLDTEPLPFMDEISRFNVQIPAISAPRHNPFDLLFDSEESMGLPPIPCSAPSVLLPRRNPFDLPYDQDEESSKLPAGSSKPFDEPKLKPYFVPEKNIGTDFESFESQLSEKSDLKESSASESDSVSAVGSQDHELSESETHRRLSSVNQDVETVDHESDLSVQIGSEQEQNVTDSVEQELGEIQSSSPVSSTEDLELVDERYDGSSFCSEEDDKYNVPRNHVEPTKPDLPVKGSERVDESQIADPVYDSSPSAKLALSHIPLLDEHLFSKNKGKEGFLTGSSLASGEGDLISDKVHTILRGINSVGNASNSDTIIADNFNVEELLPGSEVRELEAKSSTKLSSEIEDSCTETDLERPRALQSDGSLSLLLDPNVEMKNANLPFSESSVDGNDPNQKANHETVSSSSSGSTVENSGNLPKSLNPKDRFDLLI